MMECIECGRTIYYCDCYVVWFKNPERLDSEPR
jgi:hypothetical protein